MPGCGRFIERSISVAELVHERRAYDAIDAPLTDYSYSDIEDAGTQCLGKRRRDDPPSTSDVSPPPSKKTMKQKERSRQHKIAQRMKVQAEEGTKVKAVAKALRFKAVQNALLFDFNMRTDASITLPAWVGKSVRGLPRQVFTKDELVGKFGMTVYPWDGMYVAPTPPAWWLLIAGLACHRCYLIRSTGSLGFFLASHACRNNGRASMTVPWKPSSQLGLG